MTVKSENEFFYGYSAANFAYGNSADSTTETKIKRPESDSFEWSQDAVPSLGKNPNMPTKGYIDNIINQALKNIKNGENIAENRRILNIFSNIAGENPIERELKSYV